MASFNRRGFILLGKEAEVLKKKNVNIHNLSTLFSDTNQDVFVDECCHVNELGNSILAKKIIETIVGEISKVKCN